MGPHFVERPIQTRARADALPDEFLEDFLIVPIHSNSSIFATVGCLNKQVVVDIVAKKYERMKPHIALLELSLKLSRCLHQSP